jgi:hypothetical protein
VTVVLVAGVVDVVEVSSATSSTESATGTTVGAADVVDSTATPDAHAAITTLTAMANTIFEVHCCQHIGRTVAHRRRAQCSGQHFVPGTLLSYTFSHDLYATASWNDGTLRDVRPWAAHVVWW